MDSTIEAAKKTVEQAKATVDEGISATAHGLSHGAAVAGSLLAQASDGLRSVLDQGQVYADHGLHQYREAESVVLATVAEGLSWSAANPYIAYPAAAAGTLLLLPFTRRFLYRQTLGRLSSPESVVRSCEGRVKGISSKLEVYSNEVTKLQDRMVKAEAEYQSGLSKLRATRQELQRLSSALNKGERSAAGVVKELRTVSPKVEKVLELRGEAAGHASTLRSQRVKVDKWVNRIASMDI